MTAEAVDEAQETHASTKDAPLICSDEELVRQITRRVPSRDTNALYGPQDEEWLARQETRMDGTPIGHTPVSTALGDHGSAAPTANEKGTALQVYTSEDAVPVGPPRVRAGVDPISVAPAKLQPRVHGMTAIPSAIQADVDAMPAGRPPAHRRRDSMVTAPSGMHARVGEELVVSPRAHAGGDALAVVPSQVDSCAGAAANGFPCMQQELQAMAGAANTPTPSSTSLVRAETPECTMDVESARTPKRGTHDLETPERSVCDVGAVLRKGTRAAAPGGAVKRGDAVAAHSPVVSPKTAVTVRGLDLRPLPSLHAYLTADGAARFRSDGTLERKWSWAAGLAALEARWAPARSLRLGGLAMAAWTAKAVPTLGASRNHRLQKMFIARAEPGAALQRNHYYALGRRPETPVRGAEIVELTHPGVGDQIRALRRSGMVESNPLTKYVDGKSTRGMPSYDDAEGVPPERAPEPPPPSTVFIKLVPKSVWEQQLHREALLDGLYVTDAENFVKDAAMTAWLNGLRGEPLAPRLLAVTVVATAALPRGALRGAQSALLARARAKSREQWVAVVTEHYGVDLVEFFNFARPSIGAIGGTKVIIPNGGTTRKDAASMRTTKENTSTVDSFNSSTAKGAQLEKFTSSTHLERLALQRGIAKLLARLHALGIAHLDFTVENILVGSRGLKLIDFSKATPLWSAARRHLAAVRCASAPAPLAQDALADTRWHVFESCEPTVGKGSAMAPECWTLCGRLERAGVGAPLAALAALRTPRQRAPYYFRVPEADLWQLGIALAVLWAGREPWVRSRPDDPTFRIFLEHGIQHVSNDETMPYPDLLANLLNGLLAPDPLKRTPLRRVVQHAWLHNAPRRVRARSQYLFQGRAGAPFFSDTHASNAGWWPL